MVVVDASGSRLVFMDETLNKVNEVVLSSMRKTDKSGGYNALELPNGDIIYPTSFENPNTLRGSAVAEPPGSELGTDPGTRADQGT